MKNLLSFISLFFVLSSTNIAQAIILEKVFAYQNDEILFETIELNDGTFLSLGWTFSLGNGENDFYLVKTDQVGNKIWEKTFGGYEKETGICIKEFSNGNLLLSGTTRSFGNGAGDCMFIITDENGKTLKQFYYGSFGDDYLRESVIAKDESIVFTGYSNSFGNGRKDIILGKIDLNGNLIWVKNYGGALDDEGWTVLETSDNGYIVSGFLTKNILETFSLIIKTDINGNALWQQERLQKYINYGINSTIEDSKGEYISGHTVYNSNTGKSHIELFNISPAGKIITSRKFERDFNLELKSLTKTNNGYAISCTSWGQIDKSDIYIYFIDQNLNEIKSLNIDRSNVDIAWKVNSKLDKVILSGSVTNKQNGSLDAFFCVFKMDPVDNYEDSIRCIKIPITDDVAIGFHDFYSTSSLNFGNAIQFAAYTIPGSLGGLNSNRALLKFEIPALLDSVKLISAKLNLFATGPLGSLDGHTGNNNQGVIQKITEFWEEDIATWSNQPKTTIINQVILNYPTEPTQDFLNIDILELFNDLTKNNYGLLLKLKEETPTNALLFCSSDNVNSKKHPYLDVCFTQKLKQPDVTNLICDFTYYPNPSNQKLFLKFNYFDETTKTKCQIYSISGQFIKEYELSYPITIIDLEHFTSGMYIIDINDAICQKTIKFAVTKN
jgi:hypothetical protein